MSVEISVSYQVPQITQGERLLSDQLIGRLAAEDFKSCEITSEYYDDPVHALRDLKATLRVEHEDGRPRVWLNRLLAPEEIKDAYVRGFTGKADIYESWQRETGDLYAAAEALAGMGAPAEGYRTLGRYEFTRRRAALLLPRPNGAEDGGAAVSLYIDRGGLTSGDKQGELEEMSLRLIYGDPAPMLELAAALEQKYELGRILHTKYERLLNLIRSRR